MRYCPDCKAEYAPGSERCHDCDVDLVDLLVEDPHDSLRPPEPLVTVAAFDTPLKASILASRLEAEGIECFVADAETIAAHGLLSGAVGGVKVQVRASEARQASTIAENVSVEASRPPCPKCGSRRVARKGLSIPAAVCVVLTLGVLALLLPVRWRCAGCSHEWS